MFRLVQGGRKRGERYEGGEEVGWGIIEEEVKDVKGGRGYGW